MSLQAHSNEDNINSCSKQKLIVFFLQILVDGPTSGVPRQALSLAHVTLTPLVIAKLTRGARSTALTKKWNESSIDEKWAKSAWAKTIKSREIRWGLSDFQRFQVLILKKQVCVIYFSKRLVELLSLDHLVLEHLNSKNNLQY